ncbi:hypothetical protein D3C78_1160520 [compost metagenome]
MRQRLGSLDKTHHPLQMLSGNQRTQFAAGLFRWADLQAADSLAQRLYQLWIDAFLRVNATGGGAVLTGVVEAKAADPFHHLLQVGVVKHQHRRLAPQLHMGALNAGCGMANDMFAGGD